MSENVIKIKGAKLHNLKNVSVDIPIGKFVVITGVSGSGKSSLTMDTLFAEGQRRYMESLSSYARQFVKNMNKPLVDSIEGLCPAIAIEQKVNSSSTRSSVGSITEINDYLRLLFAKIGKTFSPISGKEVKKDTVSDVINFITSLPEKQKILLLIPLPKHAHKNPTYFLEEILQQGFTRLYNLKNKSYSNIEELLATKKISFGEDDYILIDRWVSKKFDEDELHRLADSIQLAFDETNGDAFLEIENTMHHFCNRFEQDGMLFDQPTANLFSSNNSYGACPQCEGYGQMIGLSPELIIPNTNLSIYDDAVACWKGEKMSEWKHEFIRNAKNNSFPIHKPIKNLSEKETQILWQGSGGIDDFFNMVNQNLYKIQYRIMQARYRGKTKCTSCNGTKLRKEALYVKIENTTIASLFDMPIEKLQQWMQEIKLDKTSKKISERLCLEINNRLNTLMMVGLNYLSLSRSANTLSGGESQRLQLTRILGSNLSDSLYILDEHSIGLHSRDTAKLIEVLQQLKNLGNTIVLVEHDEMIMKNADYIIDMGVYAGKNGGEVIAQGDYKTILKNKKSLTAQYLSGEKKVFLENKKTKKVNSISLLGCRQHNLKNIDVEFPLNMICAITGVSGSGKTTLIKQLLYPAIKNALGEFDVKPGKFDELKGDFKTIKNIEMVDQNPIGRSSRSNPVTYVKAYDEIRNLFAAQKLAKIRGYKSGHFSFNVDGGRCDECKGEGSITVEMQFLADVHLLCESCKGKKFKEELLEVKYKEKNISEILDLSVDEAILFFEKESRIKTKLQTLSDVGLGYVALGQSSSTLSGGEAQRVKLASFLDKSYANKNILFIFDEPTTGLHFHDIQKLLQSFEALIQQGHSIIVIEHNMDIIKNADWVIDLGKEGGELGGQLLYAGELDGLKKVKNSYTAKYL